MIGESRNRAEPLQAPATPHPIEVRFQAHVELLRVFLARRTEIVERIQTLLNAQRKPKPYLQDAALLSREFEDCFFALAGITHEQARLRRELDEAHWASGFKPRETRDVHNDLVDPAEMMSRAFRMWEQTRWPGRNGRLRYAHTLFALYLLRKLMLLAMRLWDAAAGCGERLAQLQGLLDELGTTAPADQPVFLRDARWLIPLAQSPTTDDLAGYFAVAEHVATTFFSDTDRIEVHKAGARMGAGHLRSQLRHVSHQKGVSIDEHDLVLSTRSSNALDLGLLIQELVPLLRAYEQAVESGDAGRRIEFADAICQGVSADPELFLNRLDLLGPYSMIEHLFLATDRDRRATYTPSGERHVRLIEEYRARIGRVSRPLLEDCPRFRPAAGGYSPYGVLFGFSSNLLEHMALKTLTPDAATGFALEDVFADGDVRKLAWVSGWRKLPHIPRDVAKLFEYPQEFAERIFERIEQALQRAVAGVESNAAAGGRLFLVPADAQSEDSSTAEIPELPTRYFRSSDPQIVAARKAEPCDAAPLLRSRFEGEFLLSYETPGGWMAITKDVLTEVVGAGRDVKIVGWPDEAAAMLRLMCPHLVR